MSSLDKLTPNTDRMIASYKTERAASGNERGESRGVLGKRAVTWAPAIAGTVAAVVSTAVLLILAKFITISTLGVGAPTIAGAFVLGAMIGQAVKEKIRNKLEAPAPVAEQPYDIFYIRSQIPFMGGDNICSSEVLDKFVGALAANLNRREVQGCLVALRSMFSAINMQPQKPSNIRLNNQFLDKLISSPGVVNEFFGKWHRAWIVDNRNIEEPVAAPSYEDVGDVDFDSEESSAPSAAPAHNRPYNQTAETLLAALTDSSDSDDLFPPAAPIESASASSGSSSPESSALVSSASSTPPSAESHYKLARANACINNFPPPKNRAQMKVARQELAHLNARIKTR